MLSLISLRGLFMAHIYQGQKNGGTRKVMVYYHQGLDSSSGAETDSNSPYKHSNLSNVDAFRKQLKNIAKYATGDYGPLIQGPLTFTLS